MSETDNNTQVQKGKTSKLAIVSLMFGVLACLTFPRLVIVTPASMLAFWAGNIACLPALAGLIVGVVALCKIQKAHGMLKGLGFAAAGIILTSIFWGVWLHVKIGHPSYRMLPRCPTNLRMLGEAMMVYAHDNGQYPTHHRWCDLLLDYGRITEKRFICPTMVFCWPYTHGQMFIWPKPKRGRCHYAMNPNASPDSPPGTVLLFESSYGWNQFGGPELLATERRHKGRGSGCFVLFNDGKLKFVKTEQAGELNWGDEQKQ